MANDTCANAFPISTGVTDYNVTGNASDTSNNPSCIFDPSRQYQAGWFSWVCPADGEYKFSLVDSSYHGSAPIDTCASGYTGSCGALVEIGCGEDVVGVEGEFTFNATSGTTYLFKATCYQPLSPFTVLYHINLTLTSSPCVIATEISNFPYTVMNAQDLIQDIIDCPSCSDDCSAQQNVFWGKWIAPATKSETIFFHVIVNDRVPQWDPTITIYTGCPDLVEVGCRNAQLDELIVGTSLVGATFDAVEGTTYYIKCSLGYVLTDYVTEAKYRLYRATAPAFETDELIVGNQAIISYFPNGTFKAIRPLPPGADNFPDIGAVAPNGDFFIPIEYNNIIAHYLADGSFSEVFDAGAEIPHNVMFDKAGKIWCGFVSEGDACEGTGNGPPATNYNIKRFNVDGTLEFTTALPDQENGGTQHLDLMSDQKTMLYTSLGRKVFAYDVIADAQLPVFATLPPASSGEVLRGIRVLPDGGALVVDKIDIKRLDSSGNVIQTYNIADQDDWGTIALDSTGTKFWAANRAQNQLTEPTLVQFDIESGDVLITIPALDVPDTDGQMCCGGIAVYGGYRAAQLTCTKMPVSIRGRNRVTN